MSEWFMRGYPVLAAMLGGLCISAFVGRLIKPVPGASPRYPLFSSVIGAGCWLALFACALLVLQRPIFAAGFVVVMHLVLVAVNFAKYLSLNEPFVIQDFEYFTDAIRHPRLYIPFFGILNTILALTAGAAAIGLFFWLEPSLYVRDESVWLLSVGLAGVLSTGLLGVARRLRPEVCLVPHRDVGELGLIASLCCYARHFKQRPDTSVRAGSGNDWPTFAAGGGLPHLVMIQSESFFDPRPFYPFVRREVLANWDRIAQQSLAFGRLTVPAWGANTVRTEAAVLSGLPPASLGVHQFNPYRLFAKHEVPGLAEHLRRQGYRTICIHPYPSSFYLRDRVMPRLGFDEFIDIEQFEERQKVGQYIGDAAVTDKVQQLLKASDQPLFIFVVTMENHGPLHLEKVSAEVAQQVYQGAPPEAVDDLTVYLGHLINADKMAARLVECLQQASRGGELCWYGDHVPIMPGVYKQHGVPDSPTPYLQWSSAKPDPDAAPLHSKLPADRLAKQWLTLVTASRK